MAKTYDELANRLMTHRQRAKASVRTRQMLAEMMVSEIRTLAGKSQRELAEILGIKQPSVAKMESAGDMQISTLRRIVAALGGELEIHAKLPSGIVCVKLPALKIASIRKPRRSVA